ncbi:sterol desaturase family protein [Kiloniella sp. b19]|uniref:sterol desaturase family protein n=1 Tax=Kiloniella sp. GXU_MW_B19 TaxID=3141326 RepID=UPI0031D8F139
MSEMPLEEPVKKPANRKWNYVPDLPLDYAPYWHWPPKPVTFLKWVWQNWLQTSDRSLYVIFAFVVAFWMQPVTEAQALLRPDWMAAVVVRNAVVLSIVAGGLHFWFYGIDGQGNVLKYDPRPISKKRNTLFRLNYQVWDNMFYSLLSGVPIASAFEIFLRWNYAQDALPTVSFAGNPFWYVALFPLLALWQSFHFYVVHRLLHVPALYKRFHDVHHRNINPGPWSGMSMHPVEHLFYFSSLLIFLIVPSDPVHMLFLLYWQMLGAASSHSGYEAVWVKDKSRLLLGAFFHQMHHRYFECNYGNGEMPWDKWFGSYHDGTEAGEAMMKERRKRLRETKG